MSQVESNKNPVSMPTQPAPEATNGAMVPYGQAPRLPANPTVVPPAVTSGPTATTLLHAFRRRWLTATIVGILGALGGVALAISIMPAPFKSTAMIQVTPPDRHHPIFSNAGYMEAKTFLDNQEGIVKSSDILNAALNRTGHLPKVKVQTEPIVWLRKQILTDYKAGPSLLSVHVSGEDPETVQQLAQAVAEEFVSHHEKKILPRITAMETHNSSEFDKVLGDIGKMQSQLNSTYKELGIKPEKVRLADLKSKQDLLSNTRRTLADLQKNLKELEGFKKFYETKQAELPTSPGKNYDNLLVNDGLLKDYQDGIRKLEKEIKELEDLVVNPNLVSEEVRAKRIEQQKLEQKIKSFLVAKKYKDYEEELQKLSVKLSVLTPQIGTTKKDIQELESVVAKLSSPRVAPIIVRLEEQIKGKRMRLESLIEEKEVLEESKRTNMGISVVQNAGLPKSPDRSRQIKYAAAAGMAGFMFCLLGIVFLEFRSRKISSADDVTKGLNMDLVGSLPALPSHARKVQSKNPSARDLYWQGMMTESVDGIRTVLLHASKSSDLKTVMVTSALAGEGKTSVASQLAASLARGWKKTLLIDGDLRNPAIHRLFNQPVEPGFSEILRGEVDFEEAIRSTHVSRLWMMSAGNWDPHAVQALAQEGIRGMFAEFKDQYDYIIIDSSPVLPVADSLLLGQHVDGVVLTILRDTSRAPAVHTARQKINNLGIRNLGAILIGTKDDSYGYQRPLPLKG